ncbi:hypothetical protein F5141DRAFT_1099121 [Pisolithus sp. B1]|nr:hypothetical protein F5141DRAFT_1099121 [Pisolithus sp. B1]
MAQPSDRYQRPLLEGQDLHYVQQQANRPTIKKILVACGTALLLGLAVSGLLHSWRLFRRHTRAVCRPPTEPYGAETSFSLPVNANSVYLLSRGANQLGNLKITQSDKESDVVDVDIRVTYESKDFLDLATVCLTGGEENQYGVSILTPPHRDHWSGQRPLHFDVELALPAAKEGSTLGTKVLMTHLPTYSQSVTASSNTMSFGKFSLASVDGDITVNSVASAFGFYKTVNGNISGHFQGGLLELVTVNGNIDATVTLFNNAFSRLTSKLLTRSANGHATSEVTLISDPKFGGNFDVDTSSMNGFVDLAITESPVGSVLKAVATTTNGEVKVAVPSTYEGSYFGTTVVGKAFVMERDVEDPEGKGRHREIVKNRLGNRVEGAVYWVESDRSHKKNKSLVKALSTSSSVSLVF